MKEEMQKMAPVEELDWDSGIEADAGSNEKFIPPVGEYGFKVTEFEKTFSKAGNRMAKLTLELDESGRHYRVTDYIVLTQPWKCAQFFESLGFKKKGESLARMPWDKVLEAEGHVLLKHELYDGKEYVKVDAYVEKKYEADGPLPFEL